MRYAWGRTQVRVRIRLLNSRRHQTGPHDPRQQTPVNQPFGERGHCLILLCRHRGFLRKPVELPLGLVPFDRRGSGRSASARRRRLFWILEALRSA